jgi:A/G-specific adenine glycosylase
MARDRLMELLRWAERVAVAKRTRTTARKMPTTKARQAFRRRLLTWYDRNGRDLPWRSATDPYQILVSEIMLQQTQVDRVLPKYHEWLRRFPSLEDLAASPVEEAVEAWYPLGYNIRPRRLHSIAREAVARYGGALPSDEATLLSFKGIGRYTAGAIRSFAFRERSAILDTNVARVLFRVFVGKGDPKSHAARAHLWEIARHALPRRRVFDFNQALMDFGALVCPARRPRCPICPMARGCVSYPLDGSPPKPGRAGRRPRRPVVVTAAVVERGGRLLVARRLAGSHMGGRWEFPGGKCEPGESPRACLLREIAEELGTAAVVHEEIYRTTYAYDDRVLDLRFFRCDLVGEPRPLLGQELRFVERRELRTLEFPPADHELVARLAREGSGLKAQGSGRG